MWPSVFIPPSVWPQFCPEVSFLRKHELKSQKEKPGERFGQPPPNHSPRVPAASALPHRLWPSGPRFQLLETQASSPSVTCALRARGQLTSRSFQLVKVWLMSRSSSAELSVSGSPSLVRRAHGPRADGHIPSGEKALPSHQRADGCNRLQSVFLE